MSDRAKARLLAAGLSILLSAQVVFILLGAIVLFNRIHLGNRPGVTGFFSGPATQIIVPISGVAGGGPGPVTGVLPTGQPPGCPPGCSPPSPTPSCSGPCPTPSPSPLVGATVQGDLPVVGSVYLPIRIGSSSGDNVTYTVPAPRARLTLTLSRHPICDLTTCTTGSERSSIRTGTHRPGKTIRKLRPSRRVPPGHSLAHQLKQELSQILHSLLH